MKWEQVHTWGKSGRFCPGTWIGTSRLCSCGARPVKGIGRLRLCQSSASSPRLRHRRGELDEEIIGGLLRRAVDEALPELGELAADLRLHVIGEKRTAVLLGERHLGAAFGKAGNAPFPLAGNAIAVRRIEVGEANLALPARLDRSDFDGGDGLEFVIGDLFELLAAGDAAFEDLGVVELGPDHLAVGSELDLPIHRHRHRPSPSFWRPDIKRRQAMGKALSPRRSIALAGMASGLALRL